MGLALRIVLSAWVFFGGWDYMGLALAVVTGFFLMAIAIPLLPWLTWRRHREPGAAECGSGSFRHWAFGDFAVWQGRLGGGGAGDPADRGGFDRRDSDWDRAGSHGA